MKDGPTSEEIDPIIMAKNAVEKFPITLPDMEFLSKLAKEIIVGEAFISDQIREPELVPSIFMPIAFGAFKNYSEQEIKEIDLIYAYMKDALPRGINGYPMFTSCAYLNKRDADILRKKVKKAHEALENI